MSTSAQKANLARHRENQRRCRARKREYLQELEQRLRLCELQGSEATAEVQVAARRVAEENRQLRELLHNQGVSDDYITYYVQASMIASDLNPTLEWGLPSPAVQALQQLLVPRRPIAPDPAAVGGSSPMAGQSSREVSITSASPSVSTSATSLWEAPQQQMQAHGQMYSGAATPRMDSYAGQTHARGQQPGVEAGMMEVQHGHSHAQEQQQPQHQQAFSPEQVQAAMHVGAMCYVYPNVVSGLTIPLEEAIAEGNGELLWRELGLNGRTGCETMTTT